MQVVCKTALLMVWACYGLMMMNLHTLEMQEHAQTMLADAFVVTNSSAFANCQCRWFVVMDSSTFVKCQCTW